MRSSERLDADSVLRRYAEIRPRLPAARFPPRTQEVSSLADIAGEFDVFVLDGYGVLNVGANPVPGAAERVAKLRAAGKRILVLTNGATYAPARTVARYARLGIPLTPAEVVSSRDALDRGLEGRRELFWGFAATAESEIADLAPRGILLGDDRADHDAAEGFALLSTGDWSDQRHETMAASLAARPRPVLVGNPDLAAPREDGLSPEPGLYAHDLADRTGCAPEFYGKPFANAFALVAERLGPGVPPRRIAMVGDTPWTDILGGAAMGWRTVLVHNHGLMRGKDPDDIWQSSGIRPDFLARTT